MRFKVTWTDEKTTFIHAVDIKAAEADVKKEIDKHTNLRLLSIHHVDPASLPPIASVA